MTSPGVPTRRDSRPGTRDAGHPDTSGVYPSATASRPRWTLPATLIAVAVGCAVLALLLDVGNSAEERSAAGMRWGAVTAAVGILAVGCAAPILARYPRHPVGWTMAVCGLVWSADGIAEAWVARGVAADPHLPLTGLAVWVVVQLGSVLLVALPVVLTIYPDGRLLSGGWGIASRVTIVAAFALPAMLVLAPPAVLSTGDFTMPVETGMPSLPLSESTFGVLLVVAQAVTLLSLAGAVTVAFARQRCAGSLERTQLRWLLWAAVMCIILACGALIAPTSTITTIGLVLCLGVTGVSMAIGILAPEARDVDALIAETLVYGLVAVTVVAIDVALIAGIDLAVGERLDQRQVALFVLLLALAVYGPLRSWIGSGVRRVLLGRRADRYDVVSELAASLEGSSGVQSQLPALADSIARAFKLRFVRVEVFGHGGDIHSAVYGNEPTQTRVVPIRYGSAEVGQLILPAVGVRSLLSGRDQELLLDVVRQAAIAVRSSRLADELQASREQLVLAREDDRRRIRRDLHDGLGPVLGGVAMRLDAAGNSVESDPETARRMLAQSRQDVTEALAEVRRLVHGLRPPALDDLGLLAALDQQAERVRSPELSVGLSTAGLPSLPAAVEVAAFRIASEALANAVRHSGATTIRLSLAGEPGGLTVEVRDDGRGIEPDRVAGVGLRSMRERAEELGGHAEVSCPPGGGTHVRAWLPVTSGGEP